MALPQRSDSAMAPALPLSPLAEVSGTGGDVGNSFEPGGQVGQMHADLAARLAGGFAGTAIGPAPEERFVRFVSVAGGWTALAAAYAGVALLFLR